MLRIIVTFFFFFFPLLSYILVPCTRTEVAMAQEIATLAANFFWLKDRERHIKKLAHRRVFFSLSLPPLAFFLTLTCASKNDGIYARRKCMSRRFRIPFFFFFPFLFSCDENTRGNKKDGRIEGPSSPLLLFSLGTQKEEKKWAENNFEFSFLSFFFLNSFEKRRRIGVEKRNREGPLSPPVLGS